MDRRLFLTTCAAVPLAGAPSAIRLGCQTRAFGSPLPQKEKLLAALDDIAAAGYAGFETNFASLEHSFENPQPMVDEFRRRRLTLIGLHGSPRLAHPELAEAEMKKGERIARAIRDLGGSYFVMSGSGVAVPARELWSKNLNRFGAYCRELGVTLCIHNHLKELQDGAAELETVAATTDPKKVSFLLDISFFLDAGLKPEEWLPRYAPRLKGIHIRDHHATKEVVLGEGDLNLAAVARSLRQVNWSGWAILEVNKRTDRTSRKMIEDAHHYIKDKMNSV